ncbi:hypothetical protein [Clostridium sp.]|uniref:YfjL-like protein n=1 Tax=Clostridium sp. TaxID=1506 RepID=UPI002FCB3941
MKSKKKSLLKILAGVVAIALISGIIFITNSFVGNPISAMMANRAIKQYVNQKYSTLDLEIEKAKYNFKTSSYAAMAESKTSIDTKFEIYYRGGKVQRDDYEYFVESRFNTLDRFSKEYSIITKDIVSKELGYENNNTMVLYNKADMENAKNIVELDMKFDKTLPLDPEVTIQLDLSDNTIESIAKILTGAHKAFVNNNCNFTKYGLYSSKDGIDVMVYGVTPKDIESGQLVSLLEKAKNNDGATGIGVSIKGEKK